MDQQEQTSRDAKKHAIIEAALDIASFEGWSDASLSKGAVKAGFPSLTSKRLFPGGVIEALIYYSEMLNHMLCERAKNMDLANMKIHERVALLVRTRLELAQPHKEAVRRASALMAMPQHHKTMMRSVWKISDLIWRLAGDTSVDYNYYTKRSLLSKVYFSTGLFWLQDTSEDHQDSWEFLDRRIANVLFVGKQMGQKMGMVTKFVEGIADQITSPRRYRTKRR